MRAILFDKDGTLLDFEATWTPILKDLALNASEGEPDTALALLISGGFQPESGRFRAGSVLAAGTSRSIVELWHPQLDGTARDAAVIRMDRAFYDYGLKHSVPFAGVTETLSALADAGYVLGVATNDGTEAAKAALSNIGVARYLPHIYGYDSVANPKPAPDMVLAFCAAAGIPANEVVVVGDNVHDLEMARAAGAALAIGVTSGNSGREHLAPLADAVLDSIRDLPGWLHQNRK